MRTDLVAPLSPCLSTTSDHGTPTPTDPKGDGSREEKVVPPKAEG